MHTVLPFPYPFKSMVAIESDIDRTSLPEFRQALRFLSTHTQTPLGRGLGLDFANSFWCYRGPNGGVADDGSDEVGYWSGFEHPQRTPHADELIRYAKAGRIGTLHSYGRFDDSFVRDHAIRALDMLDQEDLRFRLWTNHGKFHGQNIATDLSPHDEMIGARPGAAPYHADLLRDYGVRYYWPSGYRGRSEGTKTPLYLAELEDGSKIWQFVRSSVLFLDMAHFDLFARKGALFGGNNRWPGAVGWQPQLLGLWLSEARLNRLVDQGLYCVFAQHLGNQLGAVHFAPDAAAGLRRLKAYQDRGKILVASTERLLDYYVAVTHAVIQATVASEVVTIAIPKVNDPAYGPFTPRLKDLSGLSIALEDADTANHPIRLIVGDREVPPKDYRVTQEGGRRIVVIPWHAVDTTDYPAEFAMTPNRHYRVLAPAPPSNSVDMSGDDRTFIANEAGFAGRAAAIVVGDDAAAWANALDAIGTPSTILPADQFRAAVKAADPVAAKRLLDGANPPAAVLSLPVDDLGFAGVLDCIRHAARPSCSRLAHVRTVAGALKKLADALDRGDATGAAARAAQIGASELRRLGPHGPAEGPRLPRDRAEMERALVWSDLAYYGDLPSRTGDSDMLGVRDYALMAAPPAYGRDHNLTALCRRHDRFGDGLDPLRRYLDNVADVFGGARALDLTPRNAPDALGDAYGMRKACYEAQTPDADAFRKLAAGAGDLIDRLLIVRTHGMAVAPDEARMLLDQDGASAEGAALLGWLHLKQTEAGPARAAFEAAVDWGPENIGALAGLLAAANAADGPTALVHMAPTIARGLAAAERAAVAEHIGFSRPTSRPRDELI